MKVLVTAGNTLAPIDRVRAITNVFTGRTGARIALAAHDRGHSVTLLSSRPEAVRDLRPGLLPPGAPWEAAEYRTFDDLAGRMAKGLQALGVGPGVHVGLHLPNTPHYVIGFFAVMLAGGRVVNFSPLAAPRELKYQVVDSEVQIMVTLGLPTLYPQVAALKGTAKFETLVVCSLEDFLPAPAVRHFFGPPADRCQRAA